MIINIIFVYTSLYVMVLQVGKICALNLPGRDGWKKLDSHLSTRDEHGLDPEPDRSRILTFFGRIGAVLGFSAGSGRSQTVISRVCQ